MPLVKCEDCSREISDQARACPGCGRPRAQIAVRLFGFEVPFWNLTGFMVEAGLAAIPAALILGIVWALVAACMGALIRR